MSDIKTRIRKNVGSIKPPETWPNGAECYFMPDDDPEKNIFTGWITKAGGEFRCFGSTDGTKEGTPVHIGDFEDHWPALRALTVRARKRSKVKGRTRAVVQKGPRVRARVEGA